MKEIKNQTFDEERALYGSHHLTLRNISFDGPADGESALKECSDIIMENGYCNLRYPFWHVHGLEIAGTELTDKCRAALWYSDQINITSSKLHGIKALRECDMVSLKDCDIVSPEFGWSTRTISMTDCTAAGEYFMLRAEKLSFERVALNGKYSFQYITDSVFDHCNFSTKDAFWHAENITIRNSVVNGEYLAWYSKNLTFENCRISGTQPLCYCKNLRLINCEMENADLCFEKSEVEATITTPVISIKNPASGHITVPSVSELIFDDPEAKGIVNIT